MSTRLNDAKPVSTIKPDLLKLKNGQLNLELSNPPHPVSPPAKKPFTPQTPSTPLLIRQSSTSFQQTLIAKAAPKNRETCLSILNGLDTVANNNEETEWQIINGTRTDQQHNHREDGTITNIYNDGNTDNISTDEQYGDNYTFSDTEYESLSDADEEDSIEQDDSQLPVADVLVELLWDKGYKVTSKICDTSQGCMYDAVILEPTSNIKRVAIKKTEKHLYSKQISRGGDNINIITNENIIKV